MTPAPTRADLERLIAQLENWDADGESGRLLLEAAAMLRALAEAPVVPREPLEREIASAINRTSAENGSNTPDFILAQFLCAALAAFDTATQQRENWYGRDPRPRPAAWSVDKPLESQGNPVDKSANSQDQAPSVALEPPPEPGTWQCRKCGYNRTVGPTWACPTIGICEPAISPLAEPLRINERPVAWLHANHSTAYVITNRVKNIWLDCDPKHVEHYTIPLYAGNK